MVLRSLRAPGGAPSPLARVLAVLVVAGMVLAVSPLVLVAVRWFLSLF